MVAIVTDFLTVQQTATALRLIGLDREFPAGDTSAEAAAYREQHAHVIGLMEAAAQWVETQTRLGILDTAESHAGPADFDANGNLVIRHRAWQIMGFTYWAAGDPADRLTVPDTELRRDPNDRRTFVPKPEAGWPARLGYSFTRTTPANRVPGPVKTAVTLLVRDLYDGKDRLAQPNWSVRTLLQPYTA